MNKQDIYALLKRENIEHEITEHEAVYNMEELSLVELPYPDCDAKNLFVRDDKKRNFYLITVKGDKRVNLKEFRRNNGTRVLSFASPDELMTVMELIPGAVSPFGLLNDTECAVHFFIDKDFMSGEGLIGVHPNDNTATVWLKAEKLKEIIEKHGNTVSVVEIGG
ncbi:MAG: prolyl-tRNA synthetase associated domain-containing protein [Clostridia bacterium]|nr:prolyl-tRNA synthetase associated domain-containing protein [Clostridia bacterium]